MFLGLQPLYLLTAAAKRHGWGVLDILPENPHAVGLLAHVAGVLARAGISIRQVIAEDPDYALEPHLYVVTESRIPKSAAATLADHAGVRAMAQLS